MAANAGFILDEDGESSDWIELYNRSTNTVNLAGWYLTDADANLTKWALPSTNLGPGQFLVVFASNKDRSLAGRQLHTNFKLADDGEYLALVEPDGITIASEFAPYPAQLANVSYGPGQTQAQAQVITTNAAGRLWIPIDDSLAQTWTLPGFNDSTWGRATNGFGFELGTSEQPPAATRLIESGPIGYWRLNEVSAATAANYGSLGFQADASYTGSPNLAQAGLRPPSFSGYESNNAAPRFGPGNNYLTTGQPLLSGRFAFTLSGWVNLQSLTNTRMGFWGQNDVVEFGLINLNSIHLWTAAGGSLTVPVSLAVNTWYHLAAVGDGTGLKLYLNGQLIGQATAGTQDYGSSDFPFNIAGGGIFDGTGNQFDGYVDEVALFDRALPADEVLMQYQSAVGGLAGLDYLGSLQPEGWWRLGELTGSAAVNAGSLGATLDLSYAGGMTLGVPGLRPSAQAGFETNNVAARFNGSNGRVESSAYNADLSVSVFSVSAWARLTGGSGERVVVSSRDYGTPRGFVLAASTNRWRFYVADASGFKALDGPVLTSNNWVHLAATFNGTTARLYVNGALSASTNIPSFVPNAANKFRIGYGSYLGSSGYFNGDIDEVAYFKRVLTGTEVANLYNTALTGQPAAATTSYFFTPYLRTNLQSTMLGVYSSAFWRVPFVVGNPENVASLELRSRFDDGFVAYLNSAEVLRVNTPEVAHWNSTALSARTSSQAVQPQAFDLSSDRGWLVPGTNWLAIHALNASASNPDFLFQCELETGIAGDSFSAPRYFSIPTPGNPNGVGLADQGPLISAASSSPALPLQPVATQPITVTANVLPAFAPLTAVTLNWRVLFGGVTQTPMLDDGLHGDGAAGDGVYGAIIPGNVGTPGQMVRWFITASDQLERTSRWPLFNQATDSAQYLGTVIADPSIQSALPVFYSFIQDQAAANTRTGTNCSLFYQGEFYDNVWIGLHGQSSAGWTKKSYNLDFTRDHRFKYRAGEPRQKDAKLLSNWGDKSKTHNALSHEIIARAGGGSHWCFQVRVQRNGAFWSIADLMEDADDIWLERLGRDPDGALYKIYDSLASTNSAEKKTRLSEGKTDLASLISNLSETLPLTTRTTYAYDNLDLPQVVSYFASLALISSQDHGHKNYYVYRDSNASGEWAILPWDVDLTWGRNWLDSPGYFTDTLYVDNVLNFYNAAQQNKSANRLYNLIFSSLDFRNMYLRRLRTLMDTLLQSSQTPAGDLIIDTRIREMEDAMDPPALATSDADLDFTKWGTWGNGYQMRPEAERIISAYLPGRRQWLNSASALLNGTGIPPTQPGSASLSFVGVDANPASGNQAQEYICLTNASPLWLDISGWQISGAVDFEFPPGTVIPAWRELYLAKDKKAFRSRTAAPRGGLNLYLAGPYSGQLSAQGENLELQDPSGRTVASFAYPGNPSDVQRYLRITELMYNPSPAPAIDPDAQQFEYIELKNISSNTVLNLAGVRFTNGVTFNFSGSAVTSLAPGERTLVVRNQAAFLAKYGGPYSIAGEFSGALNNAGETLRLEDAVGEKVLEFEYQDSWYPVTDGQGFSLVIVDELAPWNTWGRKASWRPSGSLEGSPGLQDPAASLVAPVLVTEVLTHTDLPDLDSIELHNPTTTNVNIGGWFLTDDASLPKKYRIPDGTTLPARGYRVFTTDQFATGPSGFAFSELGDTVYLFSGDAQSNLTGYSHGFDFGAAPRGVSFGRYLDSQGEDHYVLQATSTLGTNNALPRVGPLVISEIMYHPPNLPGGFDNLAGEYLRIQNITATNVPLWCVYTSVPGYGASAATNTWKLRNAVDFDFPTNQSLAPGAQLIVVGFDPTTNATQLSNFRQKYALSTSLPIYGPWSGKLDNSGNTIEFKAPDVPEVTPTNVFAPYVLIDKVEYRDAFPWPVGADGLGLSLQRRTLAGFGNDPVNWKHASPPGTIAADVDHDGLPDWWEILNGLVVGTDDAALDPDLDAMSNRQEYLAQTNPQDSASLLWLTATPQPGGVLLSFQAQADVAYTVQQCDSLETSPWQSLQQVEPGPARTITVSPNSQSPAHRFYRVVTPQAH